jgi:hypothetical protein
VGRESPGSVELVEKKKTFTTLSVLSP